MHFLNSCLTLNSISSRITSPAWFTSTEHPGTAGDRAVLVARHALVDAEVVGFRLQDGQRVAAVVCAHDAHPASLRQQLLVTVPRQQRHRVADDVHPQRAAVAHVVRLVADLLLEDRRKTCTDHPHARLAALTGLFFHDRRGFGTPSQRPTITVTPQGRPGRLAGS